MKTLYWSRKPGTFVNKLTGVVHDFGEYGPMFTGSVCEWYETLVETLIDLSIICENEGLCTTKAMLNVTVGPAVATILECSVLFKVEYVPRPILCEDCAKKIADSPIGILSNRFTVTIDRDLPHDEIMLESYGKVVILNMNII
jgi:hypothetical protein